MRAFSANKIPRPRYENFNSDLFRKPHLDLEIGCGQGLHAICYCQKNLDRNLVAIERTHSRYAKFLQRVRNHSALNNIFPIHADAVSITTHFIVDNSLQNIFLLYPNPYPKAKQRNLRWHNMPFMQILLNKLKSGGRLHLATNIRDYAQEAVQQFVGQWHLEVVHNEVLQTNHIPRTHFEKKYLLRSDSCWNLTFQKN